MSCYKNPIATIQMAILEWAYVQFYIPRHHQSPPPEYLVNMPIQRQLGSLLLQEESVVSKEDNLRGEQSLQSWLGKPGCGGLVFAGGGGPEQRRADRQGCGQRDDGV
jgi:hypothetical protein